MVFVTLGILRSWGIDAVSAQQRIELMLNKDLKPIAVSSSPNLANAFVGRRRLIN